MNKLLTEDNIELLGTLLKDEIERVTKLCRIVNDIYELVGEYIEMCGEVLAKNNEIEWNEGRFRNMANELTHLHNEMRDVQKLLGMDGSVPKQEGRYGYI